MLSNDRAKPLLAHPRIYRFLNLPTRETTFRHPARLPDFVEPMKAKLVGAVSSGDWICEIKFDGYRALALRGGSETRVTSMIKRLFITLNTCHDNRERTRPRFSRNVGTIIDITLG